MSPSEWIKVNTNGDAFGSLGLTGCVGIFQTSRSFVKGYFFIPIEVAYSFEVELVAIYAIFYFTNLRWRRLWLSQTLLML